MIQSLLHTKDLPKLSAKVMELSDEGVIITDAEANILVVNPAMCRITGYGKNQVLGKKPSIFKSGLHDEAFYKAMWNSLHTKGVWQGEVLDRKLTGEIAARQLRISVIRNEREQTTHYIGLMQDNTYIKALAELANRDPLTNLYNRRLFAERISQAAARSRRSGKAFGLLYIDLDNFKGINDRWGHLVGDKVLIKVAKRLISSIREDDTAMRLGGDEFAVILSDVAHEENTRAVINKIRRRISKTATIERQSFNIACSVGFSLFPDHTQDVERLLLLADRNMFAEKKVGVRTDDRLL